MVIFSFTTTSPLIVNSPLASLTFYWVNWPVTVIAERDSTTHPSNNVAHKPNLFAALIPVLVIFFSIIVIVKENVAAFE